MYGFWPVEELVFLANGSTGRGEVGGEVLYDWNFSVPRSTVLTEA